MVSVRLNDLSEAAVITSIVSSFDKVSNSEVLYRARNKDFVMVRDYFLKQRNSPQKNS